MLQKYTPYFALLTAIAIGCGTASKNTTSTETSHHPSILGTYSGNLIGEDSIVGLFFTVTVPMTGNKNEVVLSRTGATLNAFIQNDSVLIPAQKNTFLTQTPATVSGKGSFQHKTLALSFVVRAEGDQQTMSGKFKQE